MYQTYVDGWRNMPPYFIATNTLSPSLSTTPGSDGSNLSAIIGGAVGGICLLLLIDTILCLIWLKKQSDGEDDYILVLLMLV